MPRKKTAPALPGYMTGEATNIASSVPMINDATAKGYVEEIIDVNRREHTLSRAEAIVSLLHSLKGKTITNNVIENAARMAVRQAHLDARVEHGLEACRRALPSDFS